MDTQIFNKIDGLKNSESEPVAHDNVPDLASVNMNDEPVDLELSEDETSEKKKKKKRKKIPKKDGASSFVTNL